MHPSQLLEGCIWINDARPGRVRLLECGMQEQADVLPLIPGVRYYPGGTKYPEGWELPRGLIDLGRYPGRLQQYKPEPYHLCPASWMKLADHQRRAVTFLRAVTLEREGAILAADPGAGKTIAALHALHLDGYLKKPGVICGPGAARYSWCGRDSDATVHYGLRVKPLEKRKNIDVSELNTGIHFFLHYDILDAWHAMLTTINPVWVIFDESHYLMHEGRKRSDAALNLSNWPGLERRYLLTGTPIPKSELDLWHQLLIAQPHQWGKYLYEFGRRYKSGKKETNEDGGHWVYGESSNELELRARLAGTFLRITKAEIKEDLPELEYKRADVALSEEFWEEYCEARHNIVAYLKERGEIEIGARTVFIGDQEIEISAKEGKPQALSLRLTTALIGLLSAAKAEAALQEVEQMLQQHDHLVVFTWRRSAAQALHAALAARSDQSFKLFGPIDGTTKLDTRISKAQDFAASKRGIYVATFGATGIAINPLKQASGVLFVDLHWNPSVLIQAVSRAHRQGNPHKKVEARFLVADRTVDERLMQILMEKAESANVVSVDDKEGLNLVGDLLPCGDPTDNGTNLDRICALLMQEDE